MSLAFYQHLYSETLFLLPQESTEQPLPAPPEKQPEKEPVEIPTPSQKQAAAPAPFALKHSNRVVVTASVDNVSFSQGIHLGNIVTIEAKVTRAFNSSIEVHIKAWAEDIPSARRVKTNEAFFTFVAVDQLGRPIDVPEAIPETEEEIGLYEGALRRRQLRLVLAGRMKPEEATELKSIFKLDQE